MENKTTGLYMYIHFACLEMWRNSTTKERHLRRQRFAGCIHCPCTCCIGGHQLALHTYKSLVLVCIAITQLLNPPPLLTCNVH